MIASTNLGFILVEFDSLKGPIIRKSTSKFQIAERADSENLLMWIIRANEFSVRKLDNQTAYAKAITMVDPNFTRKNRQFGLAIISQPTIDITEAEKILDLIIAKSRKVCNNQPYFKMLNGLLGIITNFKLPKKYQTKEESDFTNIEEKDTNQQEIPLLLISDKLNIFQKVVISSNTIENSIVIGTANAFNEQEHPSQQKMSISTEKVTINVVLQRSIPESLQAGLDIFIRILDVVPNLINKENRIQSCLEFLDRLLVEEVDIQYYMPFSQYLIAMESFTISEFRSEEFYQQLNNLKETHGEWIICLQDKELDGKKLKEFFSITGIKRESLELLVDLLFVKLIAIF